MKRLLVILFLSINLSLLSAASQLIKLEDVPTQTFEERIKKCYLDAQTEVGELSGTIPELYEQILDQGYQSYLDAHVDVAQRVVQLLKRFENAALDDNAGIKVAQSAFIAAVADPHNLDLWTNEFALFMHVVLDELKKILPEGFSYHPSTKQRIILNNGLRVNREEDRIEIAAHMAVSLVRMSQRYIIMGPETFELLKPKMFEIVDKAVQGQ